MRMVKVLKPLKSTALSIVVISLMGGTTAAHAATLPDAATPGGVSAPIKLPEKPPVDIDLAIPPRKDRPIDLEAGPLIDLDSISLFEIDKTGAKTRVDDAEASTLIETALKEKEGKLTLGTLQLLADDLSNYFRAKGLILATAYLPAQDVVNRSVELHLLPGVLDDVIPEGDVGYTAEQLRRPFVGMIGEPLRKDVIEEGLLTVLDYPGISVTGILEPGAEKGATQMALTAEKQKRYQGVVYVDNNGSRYTGEERLGTGITINNPFGLIDQLDLSLVVQNKPDAEGADSVDNALSGGVTYQFRPIDPSYIFGVGYTHNQYDVGRELANLGFSGETSEARVFVRKNIQRSRTNNLFAQVDLEVKAAEVAKDGVIQSEDNLTNLVFTLGFDRSDRLGQAGFTIGTVSLVQGLEDFLGSSENGESSISRQTNDSSGAIDFTKLELNFSRYQRLFDNLTFVTNFRGQYTNDALVSTEQFGIGGISSVRAYSGAEYMADKGAYLGLELVTNAPGFGDKAAFNGRTWKEVLQLSMFVDYAVGVKNDALDNETADTELSGAGIGLHLTPFPNWSANLTLSAPVGNIDAANGRDPQFFADIAYSF